MVAVQKRKSAPIRSERNKVEVLEGKFCSLQLFFVVNKKINFLMSHVSKPPYMCSRGVLGELKNLHSQKIAFRLRTRLEQRFCKACHIILFAVSLTNSRGSRVAGPQWRSRVQSRGRGSNVAVAGPMSRSWVQCRGRGK